MFQDWRHFSLAPAEEERAGVRGKRSSAQLPPLQSERRQRLVAANVNWR